MKSVSAGCWAAFVAGQRLVAGKRLVAGLWLASRQRLVVGLRLVALQGNGSLGSLKVDFWGVHLVVCVKGEMTVWSLYAQYSEDQDTVIKPQMPFV